MITPGDQWTQLLQVARNACW